MEELITYKVTFKETADEWLFQYRKSDGVIYSFINIKGKRILSLLDALQFPGTLKKIEEWVKFKKQITIELMLDDYSFDTFWKDWNLKIKKEQAQKEWDKLDLVTIIKCFSKNKEYDAHLLKTGQAKAHLVTWLRNKRYNDEY